MTNEHDLSDYLLGELEGEDRAKMEHRIAQDPKLRAQAERLGPLVSRLESLPAAAWQTLGGVSHETQARPRHGLRRLRPRITVALAAAAVALFAAGLLAGVLIERGTGPGGPTVVLKPLPGGPRAATGAAHVSGSQTLALAVENLPRTPAGTYYEAWLMTSTTKLVALASFTVDTHGRARVQLKLPAPASSYRYIDISRQQASKGPEHSGDSVLRGAT
jgi:anti-sigma-K factor RskA